MGARFIIHASEGHPCPPIPIKPASLYLRAMAHEMELEMVLRISSGCSGSRNGRYAAIRTVRDARQGGAYING